MKTLLLVTSFLLVIISSSYSQSCDEQSLINYLVRAQDTDSNIDYEAARHYVWVNPSCTPKNTLLLHLVGSYSNPLNTTYFPELAANSGFHVISLKYPNQSSARGVCETSSDPDCYLKYRKEVIEGQDYLPDIIVDSVDGIYNRLYRLLTYLHDQNPNEGWDNYFNTSIDWSQIMISGHSQGGGHAAIIAQEHLVKRVVMFAAPNDYYEAPLNMAAPWTSETGLTPDSLFYSFGNLYDDIVDFPEQFEIWNNLGMANYGDTINVNNELTPFSYSRMLYTEDLTSGLSGNHNNVVIDSETIMDIDGLPKYIPVWEYLLGLHDNTVSTNKFEFENHYSVYPNPANDLIIISSDEIVKSVSIYNLTGQLVFSKTQMSSKLVEIDLSPFEKGVYLLKIENSIGEYNLRKITKI